MVLYHTYSTVVQTHRNKLKSATVCPCGEVRSVAAFGSPPTLKMVEASARMCIEVWYLSGRLTWSSQDERPLLKWSTDTATNWEPSRMDVTHSLALDQFRLFIMHM